MARSTEDATTSHLDVQYLVVDLQGKVHMRHALVHGARGYNIDV